MNQINDILPHLLSWVFVVSLMGGFLAYFVHWLLVRADYRDYRCGGGTSNVFQFHRMREHIKKEYRRQKSLMATHQPHLPVAATLGEQVLRLESLKSEDKQH